MLQKGRLEVTNPKTRLSTHRKSVLVTNPPVVGALHRGPRPGLVRGQLGHQPFAFVFQLAQPGLQFVALAGPFQGGDFVVRGFIELGFHLHELGFHLGELLSGSFGVFGVFPRPVDGFVAFGLEDGGGKNIL